MKIYLVTAEHFSVPGLIIKAFMRESDAVSEAVEITNIMLKDNGIPPHASPIQWRYQIERLQDEHGAQNCYVDITELTVVGSEFIDSALAVASSVAKQDTDDEGDMIVYADESGSVAMMDTALGIEPEVDGYLAKFPAEHRESADRAYQDGFYDGFQEAQTEEN